MQMALPGEYKERVELGVVLSIYVTSSPRN